jgi:hypothetical protein
VRLLTFSSAESSQDPGNPEAPLTHHWLDSTHIRFGVVTGGYVWRNFKLEASVFNGREPDQNRWNIEVRKFDSASARLTWNPTQELSMQVSQGRLDSPELLEPDMSVKRTTASVSYDQPISSRPMQTTMAWGATARTLAGVTTNGNLLESAMHVLPTTTLFGRIEKVENDELFSQGEPLHDRVFNVCKLSVGQGCASRVGRKRGDELSGNYVSGPHEDAVFIMEIIAIIEFI